jgi:hypothetical protein
MGFLINFRAGRNTQAFGFFASHPYRQFILLFSAFHHLIIDLLWRDDAASINLGVYPSPKSDRDTNGVRPVIGSNPRICVEPVSHHASSRLMYRSSVGARTPNNEAASVYREYPSLTAETTMFVNSLLFRIEKDAQKLPPFFFFLTSSRLSL